MRAGNDLEDGVRPWASGAMRLEIELDVRHDVGQPVECWGGACAATDAALPRPARRMRLAEEHEEASLLQGGPRHAAVAVIGSAERSALNSCRTRQRPTLQYGQQSISMVATRRMKACASSRA